MLSVATSSSSSSSESATSCCTRGSSGASVMGTAVGMLDNATPDDEDDEDNEDDEDDEDGGANEIEGNAGVEAAVVVAVVVAVDVEAAAGAAWSHAGAVAEDMAAGVITPPPPDVLPTGPPVYELVVDSV